LRLQKLKKCPLVNRAVVGAKANYIGHILRERPSIIGLGYDQKAYTANLRQLLNKRGLKVKIRRLKPFKPAVYKSSLFKRKMV
jgi:glycerol-3-phosphate cytidylyltransferase-like family protein